MTTFCLVRHGAYPLLDQALGGRSDHALSEEGRAQAERLARALQERPVASVVSSPVRRAAETAEIIAARLGLEPGTEPGFAEIEFGSWTGARFDALQGDPAWHAWNVYRGTAGPPGGERALAVQARAMSALLRLAAGPVNGEVVVVSHSDVIKAVLAHVLGAPLDLMRRIEIGPCSVSRIALYEQDAKVLCMNATI